MSAVLELEDWTKELNPAQRRAATLGAREGGRFESGPLLIIAGAGTGKTNTLAHRVAYLRLNDVAAERILLLTFTRRAAEEMTRRAERIVAKATRSAAHSAQLATKLPWAGTFHSIANRLLRLHAKRVGLDPSFSVMDRGDSADLLDVVRTELGFAKSEKRFPRKDTCLAIYSHKVNTQWPLKRTLAECFPWCGEWEAELTKLYRRYVELKQETFVLDYDDLLLYWHLAMQEESFSAELGAQFDHVLVDEYQDTNVLQAEILLKLKPSGRGLCVVGDDAQAIYAFRAATVDNILSFPERFVPTADVVKLERNYRSVQPILDAANAVILEGARQYQKRLYSEQPSAQRPRYVSVADDQAQAGYVVERILATREAGVALRRQAVLMRASHHSDVLELELVRRNIPYVKYGGLKFLEAAHVKDVLAVLRWADNLRHRIAGFRALQLLPGIGPQHANRCLNVLAAAGHDFAVLKEYQMPAASREEWFGFSALLETLRGADRWEGQLSAVRRWYEPHLARMYDAAPVRLADIEQLEKISVQFASREHFLTELTLDPPQATGDLSGPPLLDEDYLILSTVHSAKGQEWDSVYVLNVTDGNFPSEFATGKAEMIEEERRLLYVAMTRAKRELHLLAPLKYYIAQQSRSGDRHVYGARSRFMSNAVLASCESIGWPENINGTTSLSQREAPRIDIASKLRALWD